MTTTMAPSGANAIIGKGIAYLDLLDANGARTGELDLGNVTAFAPSPKATVSKLYSSRDHTAGLYASAVTQVESTVKIQGSEFTKELMALATGGDTSSLVQTSGSVTAEAFCPAVKLGYWFAAAKRSISTVVVKQGVTTLVANTDYIVDAVTGRVKFLATGAAVAGTAATIDYAYAVINLATVRALVLPMQKAYLRFVGDPTAGPIIELEAWQVNIAPDGELGLISDQWGNWTLSGDTVGDFVNHPTEPYFRMILR